MSGKRLPNAFWGFAAVAVVIAINVALSCRTEPSGQVRLWCWLVTAAAILVLLGTIGDAINGRWQGIIIDARNRVSLSKFQATAWTVIVISAIATFGASRAAATDAPLDFLVPEPLLILMGIAGASLVATPAVLSLKTGGGAVEIPSEGAARIDRADGLIAGRSSPIAATWLDMFRGDEVGMQTQPTCPRCSNSSSRSH